MSRLKFCTDFEKLNDIQLLELMLKDENVHSCIYLRHKDYCINYMISKGVTEIDALDIYQDATIVLYEKTQNKEFKLTSSIQTYLNSICYYQFLAKRKDNYTKKILLKEEFDENIQDWFEEDDEIVQEKTKKILSAFVDLKNNGDKCYERLYLYYYEKLKNEEIANRLGLKDAKTVKNLINRCRNIIKTKLSVK